MSAPPQIPAPVSPPDDEDVAFLRQLVPTDPASRKRAFTHLLRQLVSDKVVAR